MTAVISIGWFIWLIIAVLTVFHFVGFSGLTSMFPEGRRWWHIWAQLGSLALFAACVLCHPFGGAA